MAKGKRVLALSALALAANGILAAAIAVPTPNGIVGAAIATSNPAAREPDSSAQMPAVVSHPTAVEYAATSRSNSANVSALANTSNGLNRFASANVSAFANGPNDGLAVSNFTLIEL